MGDIVNLKRKTINQTGVLGTTTFAGNMNMGTPVVSTITVSGSVVDINALVINLNGIVNAPSYNFSGSFSVNFDKNK